MFDIVHMCENTQNIDNCNVRAATQDDIEKQLDGGQPQANFDSHDRPAARELVLVWLFQ